MLLLAAVAAVAVGGQPQFVVVHPIVITVQPDAIPTDKVVKAEHKLPVALAVHLGQELLREVLQEHWVTVVKLAFGKRLLAAAAAADTMAVAVAVTMGAARVPTAAVAVARAHL